MKRILVLMIWFVLVTTACQQHNKSEKSETPSRESLNLKINSIEKGLFNEKTSTINFTKANQLVDNYLRYAKLFPSDSLAPEYLFKASDVAMNLNQPGKTIAIYDKLINKYPHYKNIPTCYFLKAFVYDDQLKNFDKAKVYYKHYLKKYPRGEFADDAQMALKYLGKSPEELIKTFEANKK